MINTDAGNGEHVTVPERAGRQFVYPVPSWVAANDRYWPAAPHSGSADLAAPLYTPVFPARAGEVVRSEYASGSWTVQIEHEDVGGHRYVTNYGHLVGKPLVGAGDHVTLDDPIGYLGQTGNANFSGPHIHFAIWQETPCGRRTPVKIPRLAFGDWVRGDEYVFGDYEGLEPISSVPPRAFDVEVSGPCAHVYESTERRAGEAISGLPDGTALRVTGSDRGQYRVDVDGRAGWIPHSATRPVGSDVFGVRITAPTLGIVHREPASDSEQIGVVRPGLLVGYARAGGWLKVLWPCDAETNRITDPNSPDTGSDLGGCPGRDPGDPPYFKYGWVSPATAEVVDEMTVRTRVLDLPVFDDCDAEAPGRVGTIRGLRQPVVVEGTRDGWYRITHDGRPAWIKGWFTAGPQSMPA